MTNKTNKTEQKRTNANKREQKRVATRILRRLGRGSVGVDPIGLDAAALGVNAADQREAETEFERQLG